MLQLKNIVKTYVTGDLRQDALKGVSISFRENEFVSILGQSGSGMNLSPYWARPAAEKQRCST